MPREWDFSDWYSDPPDLANWLRENLSQLMNEVTAGRWHCEAPTLLWWCKADTDSAEGLITCSPEQFKEAALFRLVNDYPTGDGAIWPTHKADVLRQWHSIRAAWGRALAEIDEEVAKVLALPDRVRL
jgi:hypothetical protein